MLGLGPVHIIILLIVVVLIFGTKKLRNLGEDLGAAVKGFKDGVKGDEDKGAPSLEDKTTIEASQKDKEHSA